MEDDIPKGLYKPKIFTDEEMPSFGISVFTALVQVILMAVRAIVAINLPLNSPLD